MLCRFPNDHLACCNATWFCRWLKTAQSASYLRIQMCANEAYIPKGIMTILLQTHLLVGRLHKRRHHGRTSSSFPCCPFAYSHPHPLPDRWHNLSCCLLLSIQGGDFLKCWAIKGKRPQVKLCECLLHVLEGSVSIQGGELLKCWALKGKRPHVKLCERLLHVLAESSVWHGCCPPLAHSHAPSRLRLKAPRSIRNALHMLCSPLQHL